MVRRCSGSARPWPGSGEPATSAVVARRGSSAVAMAGRRSPSPDRATWRPSRPGSRPSRRGPIRGCTSSAELARRPVHPVVDQARLLGLPVARVGEEASRPPDRGRHLAGRRSASWPFGRPGRRGPLVAVGRPALRSAPPPGRGDGHQGRGDRSTGRSTTRSAPVLRPAARRPPERRPRLPDGRGASGADRAVGPGRRGHRGFPPTRLAPARDRPEVDRVSGAAGRVGVDHGLRPRAARGGSRRVRR